MKKTLMTQVTNSIFDVMETMFYFTLEEKKDSGKDLLSLFDSKTLKACSIDFSGDYSGTIFLFIPLNVLTAMTGNFMGEDQDLESMELLEGTLKEALNMVAGSALTKANKESYMGLGIPEMVNPGDIDADKDFVAFNTQEGMVASFVRLNN